MKSTKFVRTGAMLLFCSPLFAGCILSMPGTSVGDDDGAASDTDGGSSISASSSNDTDQAESSSDDDSSGNVESSDGETTDGPVGECSETRILDGGFEAGTPSSAWTEASEQFGTPICDTSCTADEGAGPYAGDWYVWFGGVAEAEHASVSQSVALDGDSAYLTFRFEINASAGTGDDVFTATIDGQTVFMATDLEIADYASYTPISIDVGDFVGAGDHVVELKSEHAGTGLTSFFVDDVALVTCDDGGDSSSSDDSGGSDTSAGDSGASDGGSSDGSGDGGSSDGSSDGGESSSTGM